MQQQEMPEHRTATGQRATGVPNVLVLKREGGAWQTSRNLKWCRSTPASTLHQPAMVKPPAPTRSAWTRSATWESLASQLREEKDLRADGDKEIERSLREQTQSLEKRLRTMSDQVSQLERDFSDRLAREVQTLHEEIKRRNEDVHRTLEKMFAELSNVKTDRNLLAGLFVEVAKCLNQDTGVKGVGKGAGDPSRSWSAA